MYIKNGPDSNKRSSPVLPASAEHSFLKIQSHPPTATPNLLQADAQCLGTYRELHGKNPDQDLTSSYGQAFFSLR